MSQQSQPRPWFRLASLARPSSAPPLAAPPQVQAQAQAPPTRPPFIRPTLTQTFAPPPPPQAPTPPLAPPQAPIQMPPSPQLPTKPLVTAPPPRAVTTAPPSPVVAPPRAATPPPSSTVIAPPRSTQSPKQRISSPPSPMPTTKTSPTLSPSAPPPPSKVATPPHSPITTTNASPLLPSPKVPKFHELKTPSSKTKLLTPPPSPLTLPPPQRTDSDHQSNKIVHPKTEQEIMMAHEKILENAKPLTKDNHNNHYTSPTNHAKKEKANHNVNPHKKFSDSEDMGMSVITLAGVNKGAIMELTPSQYPKNGHLPTNRHHKIGIHDKSSSDGEKVASDSEGKGKHSDKNKSAKTIPFHAYTNSNVQGVNNSIMYNSSCTHNDPGVHLSVSRKPKDPMHPHHG